jgi:hypothetical protein
MNYVDPKLEARKTLIVEALQAACEYLELTPSQFALAKQRWEGVGACLADSNEPILKSITVYLQGSTALGTTVKPIRTNEHDVDLVAHVPKVWSQISPSVLKKAVGDCLRSNGNYSRLLEEMPRCWRLNYANEFHMDITPSIPNPSCPLGGELVPDKTLKEWKASNPKAYRFLFEHRANLAPVIRLRKSIAPDTSAGGFKSVLHRTVQGAKRHRDVRFVDDLDIAPLSVIITTLAARSYEWCVTNCEYDHELDLLIDVIRHMPDTIEMRRVDGRDQWFIWNETTAGENFAEKWNRRPERAEAFFQWHARLSFDLSELERARGLDGLREALERLFGSRPANAAVNWLTERVSNARNTGDLVVVPAIGLAVGAMPTSTPVRGNTFFGSNC